MEPEPVVVLGARQTSVQMDREERSLAIGSAHWVLCSPHESNWTPEEQQRMARYVLWASQRIDAIQQLSGGKLDHAPATQPQP